jgi:hypothetical protein
MLILNGGGFGNPPNSEPNPEPNSAPNTQWNGDWRVFVIPVAADVRWICNPPKNEYMNLKFF